jgi:hypothetical protein
LLEQVLVGERAADDPEVVDCARGEPALREHLDELREVAQMLDAAGADAAEVRRAAQGLQDAPGEARWPRTAADLAAMGATAAHRTSRRRALLVLAVAATAALVFLVLRLAAPSGPGDAPERVWMGAEGVRLLEPRVGADGLEMLEWEGRLPEGGEYRITIRPDVSGLPGPEPILERRTTETRWTLSAEESAVLGARIWIEAAVHARDGRRLGGDSRSLEP